MMKRCQMCKQIRWRDVYNYRIFFKNIFKWIMVKERLLLLEISELKVKEVTAEEI